jgi:hypothetical protein
MSEETIIKPEFLKIIKDFINDLDRTFPDKMDGKFVDLDKDLVEIYNFCKEVYPKQFFNILYQKEELFEEKLELLPGLDFSELWKSNITNTIKETIWKYLQLILFSLISDLESDQSFGDTAKLFEAINQDEFKQKIEESINEMENVFGTDYNQDSDISGGQPNMDLPNAQALHDHINTMMEGKLGCLAKEIAEETAKDLDIDMENSKSINDVFKHLFTNPTKLMDLVKNVGSKLDNKMKSGEIKESELLEEAAELVKKMKDMPGLDGLEGMLSKMGMPGMGKGAKVDMNALTRQMQQNVRAAKMRDRMRTKLGERNIEQDGEPVKENTIMSKGQNSQGIEELIFSTGEKVEKTAVAKKVRKKKPKGKKK